MILKAKIFLQGNELKIIVFITLSVCLDMMDPTPRRRHLVLSAITGLKAECEAPLIRPTLHLCPHSGLIGSSVSVRLAYAETHR